MHRILLVEDEENIQHALKLNLEMEQYKVHAVGDGNSAVRVFREEKFDLVILDVMIPEMDGLMVCENIRLHDRHVPVLFLSAKNTSADRISGLRKGADDYLTKPFDLEELLLRVKKLIEKREQMQNPESK
ncbi:MAG: response regulator transcription factor, partial [Bacteroidia bacterium]